MKVKAYSLFTDFDIELFRAGKHYRLYEKFGAHTITVEGESGTYFAVWAPSAKSVSVVGDFNYWIEGEHPLNVRWDSSGIWEGFLPGVHAGANYKYKIRSTHNNVVTEKADPYAFHNERPPNTASVVWNENYTWKDEEWMNKRKKNNSLESPFSVYEVHLESWMYNVKEDRPLLYTELATELVNYVKEMEFTHVELMPIMEYPYSPSWGYQLTGYFTPSSRFGSPSEFKQLVDAFHQAGIGVILDWVPSHFPSDDHGLGFFDGTHLYEHPDPRKGYHPDWKSLIFNYGRNEVRSFLYSNAMYWLEEFHADGLRVDAVASMLYLDYSREDGEWEPNQYGGRENLDAISFLKELNETIYANYPGVQTIAEESTSFTGVSRPTFDGGLGFGMKWMMGWMHDSLQYFSKDPVHRKYHHNEITFSLAYAFTENFMLPFSHDEVVYGKQSMLHKMPGDTWQQFANLRLLYSFMYMHPGTKLLFQGAEFAQREEWDFSKSLDWHLLDYEDHKGILRTVKALNELYRSEPALYEKQFHHSGFEWIELNDAENSVLSFYRKGNNEELVVICNMTPKPHHNYKCGVNKKGDFKELFNSDHQSFGGSGIINEGEIKAKEEAWNNQPFHIDIQLPPLGCVVFKPV